MRVSVRLLIAVLALSGVGSRWQAAGQTSPVDLTPVACAGLVGKMIPARSIALPTTGAVVDTATMSEAAAQVARGGYCLVAGKIHPVDPSAPDILFNVALPVAWNGKALMIGGAGYDGTIQDVSGALPNSPVGVLSPLARGYAVFGSDGGHQFSPASGKAAGGFLVNDEAHRNWMGEALKKTRDVSEEIIGAAYSRRPSRSYFVGGSTGGREALTVAGRWPKDWDGVVALYPARDVTASLLGMLATSQALAQPGAFLSPAKRGVLNRAAMEACDGLDGAMDGIISNVEACNARFNLRTATLGGKPVRCAAGTDGGDACLSDAQITAVLKINAPTRFGFPLASGTRLFPGYNALTSDSGIPKPLPQQQIVALMGFGLVPPAKDISPGTLLSAGNASDFFRYAVTRDPTFDVLQFDIGSSSRWTARLSEISKLDVQDRDLSGFAQRGGKLLLAHGLDDMLVTPRGTEDYYKGLRARMGGARVDRFLRFYTVPGFGHFVSTNFNLGWDHLTALENWVENGIDPANDQVVLDSVGVPGRTRPLCRYPAWPKYTGQGDINHASSFTCVVS